MTRASVTTNFPNLGLVRNVTFTCDVTVVYVKGSIHGVCFSTVSVCLQQFLKKKRNNIFTSRMQKTMLTKEHFQILHFFVATFVIRWLAYCIVLYCIVLYCIVLYCIVLYCIVLYCIVLYCIFAFYCFILIN